MSDNPTEPTPASAPVPMKSRMPLALLVVVLMLAAAAGGYYFVTAGLASTHSTAKSTPAPVKDQLDASYQTLDSSINELSSDLNNADTSLVDMQGDLSE